ncbi:jg22993, partial [Pararge aegeria aegeria]
DPLLIAPDHLRIVSRTDWLAQPVEGELTKLNQPAPWVIITHTATESCHTQACFISPQTTARKADSAKKLPARNSEVAFS